MSEQDLAMAAHLLRRAGFGASRTEMVEYASRPYEDVVEELLHPERLPALEEDLLERYYGWNSVTSSAALWIYRMVNSRRPLEEKMALFWHHVFATAFFKSEHPRR